MFQNIESSLMSLLICIAQIVGITAPAIYSGITFAYSSIVVPPLVTHAPPKLLAKQWLQAYQYGPAFVPPFILSGTISNAFLAYMSESINVRMLYLLAALSTISIMPFTLLYMEPNINGAGKWKVQEILRDEDFVMEENDKVVPAVDKHTATKSARRWAEKVDMKEIVVRWSQINGLRWRITAVAVLANAIATCLWS